MSDDNGCDLSHDYIALSQKFIVSEYWQNKDWLMVPWDSDLQQSVHVQHHHCLFDEDVPFTIQYLIDFKIQYHYQYNYSFQNYSFPV